MVVIPASPFLGQCRIDAAGDFPSHVDADTVRHSALFCVLPV